MSTINVTMKPIEWLLLVLLSLLWGGSFFFNRIAVATLPPLTVVTLRVAIAALVLNLLVAFGARGRATAPTPWRQFFVMGLLNNVIPFSLIVWSQTRIASGLASILNATTPLITIVLAHVVTRDERITWGKALGLVLGLGGLIVVVGPAALAGVGSNVAAQAAVLLAACSYAAAGVYGRVFRSLGIAPLRTASGQVTAAATMLLPIALAVDRPWLLPVPGADVLGALAGLALLSTALAYIVYFRILSTAGASNLLLVTLLIPITAITLGAAVFGERLALHQIGGMAIVFCGLLVTDRRVTAALVRRNGRRRSDRVGS